MQGCYWNLKFCPKVSKKKDIPTIFPFGIERKISLFVVMTHSQKEMTCLFIKWKKLNKKPGKLELFLRMPVWRTWIGARTWPQSYGGMGRASLCWRGWQQGRLWNQGNEIYWPFLWRLLKIDICWGKAPSQCVMQKSIMGRPSRH